jgi:hypothetical protein
LHREREKKSRDRSNKWVPLNFAKIARIYYKPFVYVLEPLIVCHVSLQVGRPCHKECQTHLSMSLVFFVIVQE